jgi:glutamyl/glutaminyl-tRNA synthetase
VNEYEAHASGGEFIVRFDDNQRDWLKHLGQTRIDEYRAGMIRDLEQYCRVDRYTSQAENEREYPLTCMPRPFALDEDDRAFYTGPLAGIYQFGPQYIPDPEIAFYPYAPAYTAERVYMDFQEGVSWLIRGIDLITECAFYEYVRDFIFGFPPVRQTYLPRLRAEAGGELTPVSKTEANPDLTIASATVKYGRAGVLEILRGAVLLDPEGAFECANIKPDPRLRLP